ncbi:isoleucyl-tRNA synthetase [Saccharopolyspora erythraea NRRL 2338]|uniref:Isoleucine--tRNA ligase n=2 Tax=Saccharopolyspora erythraea TaxID=1836 RepID=A4FLT7_SACEN|nr:isoleucine--tRNA ligase [Saccharopolyspora erythraea]EQD88168.1 isoleucyl-tRNA synthase [Saccharopolyspora erythraea D]PFG98649.1 isoleucyl-tRNA synthetase [Saccharopolyspora erythraea NRRL 2338]QRK88676.1 isoleucine--tRNA ligase [Saccharopolyspora erythraea]CAM05012.1 isoleucyl-tRNA synthetase [Saccharopolyspora erythraea NRRL 2338]
MAYPKVSFNGTDAQGVAAQPSFPGIERQVLDYWADDKTFQASVQAREAGANGANEFVFYDGPPFANGLPHYGHLLTGYVKDAVPRYQTMRGRRVERRFGWDCHGLPAEVEAEKQLGITSKSEIEAMGVAEFNDACRASVLRYTAEWEDYVTRQARWVDFDNDYKTLDLDYMESVMWAFKTLWDKGLVYEGFRVLWYCWRCETPLSNTETRMDDVYRQRQDPAVTVGLRLNAPGEVFDGALALVWTTTPWTLPSNFAAAVHPEVDYVVVAPANSAERYVLAEARLGAYARELGEDVADHVVGRMKGEDLLGVGYTPPFDFFAGNRNAHQVLPGDFVTTEDGTGIVHIAPFGEDDKTVTDAADVELAVPVDAHGKFTAEAPPYAGQHIFDANKQIIRDLKDAGLLLRHETYDHPYPHCWRCDNPLIQRPVSSWFVAVSQFKDRMVELNQRINWSPEHIRDGQFGKWLENARDWNISRNRYWGSPIPVWVSDDPAYPRTDVYGSLDELERDFGVRPTDLHRPQIDELTRPNPDDPSGKSTMRRVPEVLDCWFESGSMPYAQVHYPFENAEWFEHHYPGDFIVEYNGQTRGWFYTLHVLATALFDRPAFSNVVAHGIVLGHDGLKMSKSKKNYPDVNEVFDRDGSDAMRWFLMSSPILRGGDLVVTERGIRDAVRQAVLPLWNSWYFLALYANAEGVEGRSRVDSKHVLDRYVLAKTHELVGDVQDAMDTFDLAGACATVRDFLEVLTNWYVRRSRDRFWAGDRDAIDTLHTVLEVTCRVVAPLLPLTAESVWRGLTGGRSVHLADWPLVDELPADAALVSAMDRVRQVCSSALALRKSNKLRVRLPLSRLVVATPEAESLRQFTDLVRDEVNVKSVELTTDVAAHGRFEVAVNARAAGPRLGKDVQTVIKAVKSGDWTRTPAGNVVAAGIELREGEFTERLVSTDTGAAAALPGGSGLVVLDNEVTPELALEGLARDVVRVVQQARREADFEVSDRVRVVVSAPAEVLEAVEAHREFIAGETLAEALEAGGAEGGFAGTVGEGTEIAVAVAKS